MARNARVSLPEDEYLLLIGQVAYMVSSLEWTILGDLPGLARYLPPNLNTWKLAGKTTGQIANALTHAVGSITNEDVKAYIELGGRILRDASLRRNDLLHARPATIGDHQRLYPWKMADERGPHRALVIDTAWLEHEVDLLSQASGSLNAVRPLHLHASFTRDQHRVEFRHG